MYKRQILDMSRIEQGKMTLSNQQFHLKKCVEDCLETFRIQAQKEGKTFSLSFDLKDERSEERRVGKECRL